MKDFLFLDEKIGIHAIRFCETLRSLGLIGDFLEYRDAENLDSEIIFLASIDKANKVSCSKGSFVVGVSWAFDIERNLGTIKGQSILREVFYKLDLLVVDCDYYYNKALQLGMQKDRLWRMPYGVDLDKFPFQTKRRDNDGKIRIFSNRSWEKGYGNDKLLAAIEAIENSGLEFKIVVANSGSTQKSLIRRYRHLINSGKVELVGQIAPSRNIEIMQNSDLFVSASVRDGWSVSVMEAMAIGIPVIAAAIPQNCDLITDEQNGFLFDPTIEGDLATCLKRVNQRFMTKGIAKELTLRARLVIEKRANFVENLKLLILEIQNRK